jgi:hypothetical protein
MKKRLLPFCALLGFSLFASAQTVLFDFGRHDNGVNGDVVAGTITNGVATGSAIANGGSSSLFWNSVGGSAITQTLPGSGSFTGFVNTDGSAMTGWEIDSISGTSSNGFLNGALKDGNTSSGTDIGVDPLFANLGDVAVPNATGDYWFANGGSTSTFTLSGLDDNKTYDFTFFGSRWGTDARYTEYTAGGTTAGSRLQTTGVNIGVEAGVGGTDDPNEYNGNDSNFITISGISPTSGSIVVSFKGFNAAEDGADTFGYLNTMQVTVIPEPSTLFLVGLTGLAGLFVLRRRKA